MGLGLDEMSLLGSVTLAEFFVIAGASRRPRMT